MKTDELGAQISDLKKKQQDLLREKKKLQSELRNTQKKKAKVDQTHADAERQRFAGHHAHACGCRPQGEPGRRRRDGQDIAG